MTGCIIPEDDVFLEPDPILRNRPPRIVEETVSDPQKLIRIEAGDSCLLQFRFSVEDADVRDTIYYRWYITTSGGSAGAFTRRLIEDSEGALVPGELPLRSSLVTQQISLNSPSSPITQPGTYLIEARIADGSFISENVVQSRTVETFEGPIDDPSYIDTFVWTVSVETSVANCVPPGGTP